MADSFAPRSTHYRHSFRSSCRTVRPPPKNSRRKGPFPERFPKSSRTNGVFSRTSPEEQCKKWGTFPEEISKSARRNPGEKWDVPGTCLGGVWHLSWRCLSPVWEEGGMVMGGRSGIGDPRSEVGGLMDFRQVDFRVLPQRPQSFSQRAQSWILRFQLSLE